MAAAAIAVWSRTSKSLGMLPVSSCDSRMSTMISRMSAGICSGDVALARIYASRLRPLGRSRAVVYGSNAASS